jgi:nitrite reductase/ring-hydroxylating ferredoxin subunit
MKPPNPNDSPPRDDDKLYSSCLGDSEELRYFPFRTVYNYDDPTEHIYLITGEDERVSLLSGITPCCHEKATVITRASQGHIDVFLRCKACNQRTFCSRTGQCREDSEFPGLRTYTHFERSGRLYIKHHDKNLGLMPPAGDCNVTTTVQYH